MISTRTKIVTILWIALILIIGMNLSYGYTYDMALQEKLDSKPIWTSLGIFKVTAYTAGFESCGKLKSDPLYGQVAISGSTIANYKSVYVKENYTIASDWTVLPPLTKIRIKGLPYTFVVEDKGGKVKGNHIDIFMEDLQEALNWGVQELEIYIWE